MTKSRAAVLVALVLCAIRALPGDQEWCSEDSGLDYTVDGLATPVGEDYTSVNKGVLWAEGPTGLKELTWLW